MTSARLLIDNPRMRAAICACLIIGVLACTPSVPINLGTDAIPSVSDAGLSNIEKVAVVLPSPACPIDKWIDGRMDGWTCVQNISTPQVLWVKTLMLRDEARLFMQRVVDGELRIFDVPFEAGLDSSAAPVFSMVTNGFYLDVRSLVEVEKNGERISAMFGTGFKDRRYPGRFGVLLDGELTRTYDCTDEADSSRLGAASESDFWINEYKSNGCYLECSSVPTDTILFRVHTNGVPRVEGPICFNVPGEDDIKHYNFIDFLHPKRRTLLSIPSNTLTVPANARIHRFDDHGQVTSTVLLDSTGFYSGTWMPSDEIWLGFEPLGFKVDGEEQTQLRAFHVLPDDTVDSHVSVLNELFLQIFHVAEMDGHSYFIGEPRRHIAPVRDSFILARQTGDILEWTLIPMSVSYWIPEVIRLNGKPHVVVRVKRGGDEDPWLRPTLLYKEITFDHSVPLEEGAFP